MNATIKFAIEEETLYNKIGNIKEKKKFKNDSLEFKINYYYDSIGNNIQTVKLYGNGSRSIWNTSYDTLGRIAKMNLLGECDQIHWEAYYEYDSSGNKNVLWSNYNNELLIESNHSFNDITIKTCKYCKGMIRILEEFNLSNQIIVECNYENGVLTSKTTYNYLDK